MNRILRLSLLSAALPGAALSAQTMAAHASEAQTRAKPARKPRVVIYNRDSKDPNVGWHWENGMRTCTHDCENPEAPGSGYTCTYHADGWRECVK